MNTTSPALVIRRSSRGTTPSLSPRARADLLAIAEHDALDELVRLAQQNRMTPWLSAAIAADPELCSSGAFDNVIAAGSVLSLRSLELFAELARLVVACNQRGVDVIALKGPAVSRQYYPEASLRTYGDIDVLIQERDLPIVSGVLESWGYAIKPNLGDAHRLHECHGIFQRIYLHPERHLTIEIHCDHLQIGLEPVGMEQIWDRAREMRFGRGTARVLEPTDLFLQLCVHLHRHGFQRLLWYKDLDLMIRSGDVDWLELERGADRQGCRDSVAHALYLLERMLGTPLPPQARVIEQSQPRISRWLMKQTWPVAAVLALEPQRKGRFRRAVQFAPETGVLRGGIASFAFVGRRADKLRVLGSALSRNVIGTTGG